MKNCKDCRHFEEHKRGNLCWFDFDDGRTVDLIDDVSSGGENCCVFRPRDYQIGDVFEARLVVNWKVYGHYSLRLEGENRFIEVEEQILDKLKLVKRENLTPAGEEAREMSS